MGFVHWIRRLFHIYSAFQINEINIITRHLFMITYGHITNWEAGKKIFTCVTLVNVFEIVKVKSNYFMCNQWR